MLIFCQEVRSDERIRDYPTTGSPIAPISTSSYPIYTTAATTTAATTTTSSLYCGADKCDRHSILIYDLEQKFKQLQNDTSDLRSEVEILKADNEDLNRENKIIKEDLKDLELEVQVLKEENDKLKNENEGLKEDVKQLQG